MQSPIHEHLTRAWHSAGMNQQSPKPFPLALTLSEIGCNECFHSVPRGPWDTGGPALLMIKMSPDCKLHNCKHLMGEPLLWVSLRAVTLETGQIPCGPLEATMELLQKKKKLSPVGHGASKPRKTHTPLCRSPCPDCFLTYISFRVNLMPCGFESKRLLRTLRTLRRRPSRGMVWQMADSI